MTDANDFIKVLQDWKDQSGKTITNVLKRVSEIRQFKPNEIDDVLKAVVDFHREIGRADEEEVDLKWFPLCIEGKKKLKKAV